MTQELQVEFGPQTSGPAMGPVRFGRRDAWCEVDEVLDHWPGDGYEYYKLRSRGGVYILRWEERRAAWQLHSFHDEVHASDSDSPLVEY